MYRLIIWHAVYMQEIEFPNSLILYLFEDDAIEYAEFWLIGNPDDIVMLVELETDICHHCREPIQEKPGWIVHRWIHIGSQFYTCEFPMRTQATPKEVDA